MDTSSPEFVAGRVVAVYAAERLIRARTAVFVWAASGIAALLVVGAVSSQGVGAVIVGVFAFGASAVAITLLLVRAAVLRVVRRFGGGPDYARLRPLVAKRMNDVSRGRQLHPLEPLGAARLVWMARRPAELHDHLRQTTSTVLRTIPEVVADVRSELAGLPT